MSASASSPPAPRNSGAEASLSGTRNLQVRLSVRADGIPTPGNFTLAEAPLASPPPGGALVRVLLATVDPAMRGWVSKEENYLTVATGEVMRAHGVGEIIESDNPAWAPGDHVYGWFGWQQFACARADELLWKVDLAAAPADAWLGILGLNGLTAWVGLNHLARGKAGETIVVSTAAGGVGGAVGQLAKALGMRAIGLTGSDDKVALACDEFGYSEAINYKSCDDLRTRLVSALPDGAHVFFDNTGGSISDAAFTCLATGGRIIQCGTASTSTWIPLPEGPRRERDMLVKRLSWQGLVVFDHVALFPEALGDLTCLYTAGTLRSRSQILDGLEQAPGSIAMLYRGENTGRLLVRP